MGSIKKSWSQDQNEAKRMANRRGSEWLKDNEKRFQKKSDKNNVLEPTIYFFSPSSLRLFFVDQQQRTVLCVYVEGKMRKRLR